jgi:hypothetical protein
MKNTSLFEEFLGHEVKAPYKDGSQFKIARGKLKEINNGFVKIVGKLGTIIVNEKNIEKMALIKTNRNKPS